LTAIAPSVNPGLEGLLTQGPAVIQGRRLGLLCNPASVDHRLRHARDLIAARFPGRLKAIYSPQHGFFAEKQDNMIESDHLTDPILGIPIFSLYGATRIPTADMLAPIDVLIIDLQDAGTRVYTFIYTLSYCLEAAKREGKTVVVLDRPNPIGGLQVEGNCLEPALASFVGRYPIPMRHGLTIGELARLFNTHFGIGANLEVIPMNGWQRWMYFDDTGLPWVAPSPNLPTPVSAMVYPGQVLWEGTQVSEGRGTTQPFEMFGAPFIDPQRVMAAVDPSALQGIILRPCAFEPAFNKWQGRLCRGFQLHVTNPQRYCPYRTSLCLLQAVIAAHGDDFQWKPPPYEYEFEKWPIDLILGNAAIRQGLENMVAISKLERAWQPGLEAFADWRQRVLLY
jgi:uncharacterized protein YbbC (DUF1343 family)